MAREFAKKFYNSKPWRKCRAAYIAERERIDGGMCETCHEQPGYIVHHEVWLTPENINNPDISLNLSLLKYDCLDCHNKEKEGEEEETYTFDAAGHIFPINGIPP